MWECNKREKSLRKGLYLSYGRGEEKVYVNKKRGKKTFDERHRVSVSVK